MGTTEDNLIFEKKVMDGETPPAEEQPPPPAAEKPAAELPESPAAAEKREILTGDHWEVTNEELNEMTPSQYGHWREKGSHLKPPEEPERKAGHTAEEMEKLSKMTVEEYAKWRETARVKPAPQEVRAEKSPEEYHTPW